MPDQTIPEITNNIKLLSSKSLENIKFEIDKLLGLISADIQKLVDISNQYVKKIEESKLTWGMVKEEVEKLESRKEKLVERETEVDNKIKRANEQEVDLANLHDVLERRRKVLDIREQELNKKHQIIDERIKNYKVAMPVKNQ